jgi:hypothetical protein
VTRHLKLELCPLRELKMRSCNLDNPARRPDAAECGERIRATLSKVFGHSEGTDKFEQIKFLNFRHECGSVVRSKLVS